jgi:hypothetical protein
MSMLRWGLCWGLLYACLFIELTLTVLLTLSCSVLFYLALLCSILFCMLCSTLCSALLCSTLYPLLCSAVLLCCPLLSSALLCSGRPSQPLHGRRVPGQRRRLHEPHVHVPAAARGLRGVPHEEEPGHVHGLAEEVLRHPGARGDQLLAHGE